MLLLPIYSFIVKIGCAFMTGAIIGFERQCKLRNAGLRTNTRSEERRVGKEC